MDSISSGATYRALPSEVNVFDAETSVTSSMILDIPKSHIRASPWYLGEHNLVWDAKRLTLEDIKTFDLG